MKCLTTYRPGHDRAFTLLELLAAIGIVVVLAALLLGGLKSVREASEKAKCASHLRVLGNAILTYAAENNGRLPPGARNNMGGTLEDILANAGYTEPKKDKQRIPRISDDVFYCPTNVRLNSPPAEGYPIGPGGSMVKGWSGYDFGYVMNGSIFKQTNSKIGESSYKPDRYARLPLSSIKEPSRTVALTDMQTRYSSSVGPPSCGFARAYYFDPETTNFVIGTVHNGSGNILFLDGHVESFSRKAPISVYSLPSVPLWPGSPDDPSTPGDESTDPDPTQQEPWFQ